MNLDKARQHYYDHSGSLSSVNRNLAFAGIAVIWVFAKTSTNGAITIPPEMILPLIAFVTALAFDLLHYTAAAWSWGIFQLSKEKEGATEDDDFLAPEFINWLPNSCWILKVVVNIVGYGLLLKQLSGLITQ